MKFKINGVDHKGEKKTMNVEAATEDEALADAKTEGIFTTSIVKIPDRMAQNVRTPGAQTGGKMKFDWYNWNFGGKVIFVATCVAMVSMLMKWVDVGILSQSGLSQGAFLFLGLWIYPFLMLFKNKSISRVWGLLCSIASVVFALSYISSKSIELFGEKVNVAATGAYLFMLASIALIFGIIKYEPADSGENNAEQSAGVESQ